ncbi:hypothetical protein, partial [Vibrio sp. S9_S30]|uniref:hypothetical protein n=1 Tax=Vibrio sp. S9_S30 TaxID=2720226 RepID=UPI001EED39FA
SEPNPYGSTWDCTSDAVNIGDYNQSVSTSLKYSAAVEAYKSKIPVRIGVKNSGSECFLEYITLK